MMKRIIKVGVFIFFIFMVWKSIMAAEVVVKVPGSFSKFISYMQSYSATGENLIYLLSETLMFEQMPDFDEIMKAVLQEPRVYDPKKKYGGFKPQYEDHKKARQLYDNIRKNTLEQRLKVVISQHRTFKKYLAKIMGNPAKAVSLDLKHPKEYALAQLILKKMGVELNKNSNQQYRVLELNSPGSEANQYYKIMGFNTWDLERVLNKSHRFDFQVKEFDALIPWSFDFLREITGLDLNPESFTGILARNERFRLLVELLYRLSDREIDFINNLQPNLNAWKKIYNSDKFLCGMFVLSHALRVKNGQLVLPGAPLPEAATCWNKLAGSDYLRDPFTFLEQLALKDGGKLNYFYTFTFFLPEDTQKAVLFNFDQHKFQEIYRLVELDKKERIKGLAMPGLKDFGFFTLVYALETRDGEIDFPGGIDAWAAALMKRETKLANNENKDKAFELLVHLLKTSQKEDSLNRFIPIYCKFFHRPGILTREVIRTLYENYPEYNVLVDFIEKIPIKNPQTVLNLFSRVKSINHLPISKKEKEDLIVVFQCLLELLAQKAKYAPNRFQYDGLIEELLQMPLTEESLYDNVFRFFARHLEIDLTPSEVDQSFWDLLLPVDPEVVVHNQAYRLAASPLLKKEIGLMLEKQSVANLSQLVNINRLLRYFASPTSSQSDNEMGKQLFEALHQLPLPEETDEINGNISSVPGQAPGSCSTTKLFNNFNLLLAKKKNKAPQPEIAALIREIKDDCLLRELKHFLLTTVYAVTTKNSRLPVFLNPNLTRQHDFSPSSGKTPWNHSAVSQDRSDVRGFHLEGGLSRLNITLAFPYTEHLFGRQLGYKAIQGIPIIVNILDLFPYPLMNRSQEYTGLLIKFSEELLEKSRENPELRETLEHELMKITAGYHYRAIMEKLENPGTKKESPDSLLYVSELLRLGEDLFNKGTAAAEFSQKKQLEAFREPSLYRAVNDEMNQLGSIYYYTFGTLKPYRYPLFPQPLSRFFASQWTAAEMINELKVNAAYLSYLHQLPPQLLGYMTYGYLFIAADLFFHDYKIDYHRTYYMHSIFSYLYLNQIYNMMRKQGVLRIK
jgi:hypothetical protein